MAIAQLDWSLEVECPNCKTDLNLADGDYDSEGDISSAIFTNRWDRLNGFEICCEKCSHDFLLDSVEY